MRPAHHRHRIRHGLLGLLADACARRNCPATMTLTPTSVGCMSFNRSANACAARPGVLLLENVEVHAIHRLALFSQVGGDGQQPGRHHEKGRRGHVGQGQIDQENIRSHSFTSLSLCRAAGRTLTQTPPHDRRGSKSGLVDALGLHDPVIGFAVEDASTEIDGAGPRGPTSLVPGQPVVGVSADPGAGAEVEPLETAVPAVLDHAPVQGGRRIHLIAERAAGAEMKVGRTVLDV